MIEDRVTLPLAAVKVAAKMLCQTVCIDPWTGEVLPGGHDPTCLMATLTDAENAAAAVVGVPTGTPSLLSGAIRPVVAILGHAADHWSTSAPHCGQSA